MEQFASGLAKAGHKVVYGGACVGLMGHLADVALSHGGVVRGVIPKYINKKGIVHESLTELLVVDNLLDRKRAMLKESDCAVAFPGGIGTIDEITEALALKQLGEFSGQILFYNFLDSWRPLLDFFEELQLRKMISQPLGQLYNSFDNSEDLLEYLVV